MAPKLLTVDIENRPSLGYIWDLWNQNLSLPQMVEYAETICFAAKWHHSKQIEYYSTYHHGKEEMVAQAHRLLSEADVVIGYNSKKFDLKHLNREFILAGMEPPAPYQQVDLYLAVRNQFKFASNKLDHVAQQLSLGGKTQHTGFQLWVDCMAGSEKAWNLMRRYNKQDVVLTEKLYDKLLPWIPNHPNVGLYDGIEDGCVACGSTNLQSRGYAYTSMSSYQRLVCLDCGKWNRGNKRMEAGSTRGI